jgi:hypothetical protein
MPSEMEKLARQFADTMTSRMRQETSYHVPKTRLGYVVDTKNLTVEVSNKRLSRGAFRVAKNVSVGNLRVNDEVLMIETTNGSMVLVAVIRTDKDTSDNFGKAATNKFVRNIGDGTATTYSIVHNLGTRDIHVSVYNKTSNQVVVPSTITLTSTNAIQLVFPSAPSNNNYRVVILK